MTDDERWRRERRAIVRRHHPDLGGDASELQRRLQEHDACRPRTAPVRPGPAGPDRQVAGLARRSLRVARAHLPRGWPGRRRYIQI